VRYTSIDILRSLAIVVMVLVHFGENLSGWTPPFAGLGAPMFAYLSGVSWVLWSRGRRAKGATEEEISRTTIRRGLFVFGVGILFNVLVWLPEDVFNWDVLTFVGSGLLFLDVARRMPRPVCWLVVVLVLAMAPVFREMADYDAYWSDGAFDPGFALSDVVIGYLATGYFPIFPWLAFTLMGSLSAGIVIDDGAGDARAAGRWWLGLGAVLVAASFAIDLIAAEMGGLTERLLGGWSMFPASTPWTLRAIGVCLLLLAITHRLVDHGDFQARHDRFSGLVELFSRYSLTIYVVHHLVHLWPVWIMDLASGRDVTESWRQVMPTGWALALGIAYLVATWLVLRWLGPSRRVGLESAMRWLCDEPIRESTT
jgi:hypothetical protein